MVRLSTPAIITILLVIPSLAIPIYDSQEHELQARSASFETSFNDLETRDPDPKPKFGFLRKVKKFVNPTNIHRAKTIAKLFLREDFEGVEVLDARDLGLVEDIEARSPKFGFLKKIKKVVNPTNIHRAQKIAGLFLRDDFDDIDELSERDFQDLDENFSARDMEILEDLEARYPKFGFLKKIKKVVNPTNIHRAEKLAGLFLRDSGSVELTARDLEELADIEYFTARDLELMSELEARHPGLKSFWRKVKNPLKKVAGIAATVLIREDDEVQDGLFGRDGEYSGWGLDELN